MSLRTFAPVALAVDHGEALHGHRAQAERVSEAGGDVLELQDALRGGLLVDAEDGRDAVGFQMGGDGLVGGQHELLDEAMGEVAGRAGDAGHLAPLVEFDQGLGEVEVDGAALDALAVEDLGQVAHVLDASGEVAEALALGGVAFQEEVYGGVGEALRAADDAASELLGDDVAVVVDFEQGGEHQAVHLGLERADFGGELQGQHGHGAVGEVDAGAAQGGLAVDGRAGAHVVADVGDVDLERVVAVGEPVHPDGVVEVARGFAVDGDDVERAEVGAGGDFAGGDGGVEARGLLDHLGRELVGQVVLADDDFDVHAEVVGVAEDFDDAARSALAALRELEDFGIHDHAVEFFGREGFGGDGADAVLGRRGGDFEPFGDFDPGRDAVVMGDDDVAAAARAKLADDGGVRAFEDLEDAALGAAGGIRAGDADEHAVAVHGLRGGGRGEVDVALDAFDGAIGDDEAEAIAVHAEAAGDELAGVGGGDVEAGLEFDEFAAGGEAVEGAFEFISHGSAHAEFADELLGGGRARAAGAGRDRAERIRRAWCRVSYYCARSRRPPSRWSARSSRTEKIRPHRPSVANMIWLDV